MEEIKRLKALLARPHLKRYEEKEVCYYIHKYGIRVRGLRVSDDWRKALEYVIREKGEQYEQQNNI